MPKQKTRKSVTKRFKITKNGKVMFRHNFSRHLRIKKSRAKKRAAKRPAVMTSYYAKKIRKSLGVTLTK
ncbi:MAG TPA: 50S ribosomal protein L35 [Patescibacteria group bacterium]|nr:50S ribosomal protein L35 [Patescibacteria group bacterium]